MPRKRRTYHHGNLKRALLDAALALIDEGGLDHFTMAAAGRTAGVSSGAPYRHFPDRKALLTALAEEGLGKMEEAYENATENTTPGPEQFAAICRTQVGFSKSHSSYFRVMNTPEYLDLDTEEAREDAAENRTLLAHTARGSRDAALQLGAQAAIYGLARMVVDGHFGADPVEQAQVEDAAQVLLELFTKR